MAEELDFGEEFLNHSSTSKGSGFLKNWKEDGRIVVWIHPTAPIYSLWSHGWRRIDTGRDDDDNPLTEIRNMRINCLEREAVLKKQKFREEDGSREVLPAICPHCKAVEWVRDQIRARRIDQCDPLFEFKAGSDTEIIYAGGFCGLFQRKNLEKDERELIKERTGIRFDEVYMQNGYARQQYVFTVLADNDTDAGWVVAIESQTLGSKLQKEIRDEIKRCNGDQQLGHPKFNPYPFEWSYDENKSFADKYDVVALARNRPSAKIEAMLKETPPDMSHIVEGPKLGTLLKSMKQSALIDMPFDEFFEEAVAVYGAEEETEHEQTDDEQGDERAPEVNSDGEQEALQCDVCEAEMCDDDMTCKNCGAEYGENSDGDVVLKARRCGNQDCMEQKVPVNDDGTGTCPQCGAVHDDAWSFTLPEPKSKPTRRSRNSKRASKRASSSK